jgi:hypothetical protein
MQLTGARTHSITVVVTSPTTDPDLSNNQGTETTVVTSGQRAEHSAQVLELLSTLDVRPPDGRIRARITINDAASEETSNTGARPHRFRTQAGENRIAAQVQLGKSDSGTWRLDFGSTRAFVPGSLRVESGQVVSQDASSVTFGLRAGTNDLRFSLQLSEPTH